MKNSSLTEKLIAGFLGAIVFVSSFNYFKAPTDEDKYIRVVEKVLPAVVEIHVVGYIPNPWLVMLDTLFGTDSSKDKDYLVKVGVLGSGVFINSDGYILTVAHLFNGFKKIENVSVISANGDTVAATIKDVSQTIDLGLIKVDYYKNTPYVALANPSKLKVGQEVVAIGSPAGLSFSVTNGIISGLYRDFPFAYNVTQSNTAINPGNSGGPLFNLKGELVGINSFFVVTNNISVFTGLGFSVQSGQCLEFLTRTATKFPDMKKKSFMDKVLFRKYAYEN